jgi:hypothetical protein
MSRYFGELASTALLTSLGNFSANTLPPRPMAAGSAASAPTPINHVHRDRDAAFGIGYGNSSGYGTDRRYVTDWWPQRFRCM